MQRAVFPSQALQGTHTHDRADDPTDTQQSGQNQNAIAFKRQMSLAAGSTSIHPT